MIDAAAIARTAAALDHAERTRQQIGLVSLAHPEAQMADAYAIQAEWVRQKLVRGRTIIGYKIGLTSRAMQQALNIDIPDSGVLFDDMVFANGATIPPDRFIAPRVEAEIAFLMGKDLKGPHVTPADVIAATEAILPSLEILDTRVVRVDPATKKTRTIIDTIADNAANAGIVVSETNFPPGVDMRWMGAIVTRDGIVEETGLGAGVLNDPALGIAWLANRLAEYGVSLQAGQIVLSGSFIRPIEAGPGALIDADFGPYGMVRCRFA